MDAAPPLDDTDDAAALGREAVAAARRRGIAVLVLSSLLFGMMALVAKRASALVPGPQVALVRFAVCLAVTVGYHFFGKPLRLVNGQALALRGVFGGLAVVGYFVTLQHLPVGLSTLIQYTSPVAVAFLAAAFLGERIGLSTVASLALTSAGVILVVHARAPVGKLGFGAWEIVGLLSAVASAVAVTAIRWARRTDGHWEVLGAFSLIGAAIACPFALPGWVSPSPRAWALMVGVALLSVAAQLLLVWAMRWVTAATTGVVSQLTPLSALALGVLFLDEPATTMALVGAALTVAGVAWAAWSEQRALATTEA